MKKKMNLAAEIDLTQDSVVQLTCWCGQIALHELWGLGRVRLDRITRRQEQLGNESLAVVMVPDRNGMPQTEKARQLRAEALPEGVPVEFRVPALRTPRSPAMPELLAAPPKWELCLEEPLSLPQGPEAGKAGAELWRLGGKGQTGETLTGLPSHRSIRLTSACRGAPPKG